MKMIVLFGCILLSGKKLSRAQSVFVFTFCMIYHLPIRSENFKQKLKT